MKKLLFACLALSIYGITTAQTKEEIAKAVITSFKRKDARLFKLFVDAKTLGNYLQEQTVFRSMDSAVEAGVISWEKISQNAPGWILRHAQRKSSCG